MNLKSEKALHARLAAMAPEHVRETLRQIVMEMYGIAEDGGLVQLDPNKEWDQGTIERVATILDFAQLHPADFPNHE